MATARFRLDIPQAILKALDAQARRQLGPVVTELGGEMVDHARSLAKDRLVTDRPESRRSIAKGKDHYVDSFKVGAPDLSGNRVRVVVYNDHPFAHGLEDGWPEHEIEGPGQFPFASLGAAGGDYAATGGRKVKYGGARKTVDAPENAGYHIVADTRTWAKTHMRTVAMRIKVSLKK